MSPAVPLAFLLIGYIIHDLRACEKSFLSFVGEADLVSYEGDEFRIGGLSFAVVHGVTKKGIQSLHFPSAPGHFDGMADGPFHTA